MIMKALKKKLTTQPIKHMVLHTALQTVAIRAITIICAVVRYQGPTEATLLNNNKAD